MWPTGALFSFANLARPKSWLAVDLSENACKSAHYKNSARINLTKIVCFLWSDHYYFRKNVQFANVHSSSYLLKDNIRNH
jgi:hypothetical protein